MADREVGWDLHFPSHLRRRLFCLMVFINSFCASKFCIYLFLIYEQNGNGNFKCWTTYYEATKPRTINKKDLSSSVKSTLWTTIGQSHSLGPTKLHCIQPLIVHRKGRQISRQTPQDSLHRRGERRTLNTFSVFLSTFLSVSGTSGESSSSLWRYEVDGTKFFG